ncbi:hypothetical protein PtrSN002B_011279 [Pyrenophora tritici-repentis]|uniref:DUF7708 domain-containing protein n=2 Tax=Pyrenophora tritici-repentis TaxID=45151 RepID=A0A2W1H8S8_9PLEO|nr:uncharacterized protein PTRG_02480 [Pyrenophora tritici-repentis Pt-1C-BFP]KAA8623468.1 hypothetical protein PtrV1_04774 [Pyrenophora tritici-repentis]EDU45003.1 predicted protein [Pyrenophora tritici-repentis Pt-1C-BFP]KAF7452473.1 hypothetical protein A1F99_042510 [Pyrenophora tritici-repentis]KAF7574404.1 hypothetical protein PtrM4_060270 [Pyrenophora tritici-repentis]KAI0587748.1 hypothetical protein Alg215_01330 [Pyrenophora tritici-repentis]
MIVANATSRVDIEKFEGAALVRRFTDELKGQTTLERATISAQQEQDALIEEQMEARMRALYKDPDGSGASFHAAESARLALVKTCKTFETQEQPSTLSKIGFNRKPARSTANTALQSRVADGFVHLSEYIGNLETEWRSKQGRAAQRFRSICGGLNAHKSAFEIFPSQNEYASALCGGLKLIVTAAVNHDEISDTISETVTTITEKAGRASYILLNVRSKPARELYSELYAQVFLFYRDAIEWYMKSKTSRFFSSFNENLKGRYQSAAEKINAIIYEMHGLQNTAQFAYLRINLPEQQRLDEILHSRQQNRDSSSLVWSGMHARRLLLSLCDSASNEASNHSRVQYEEHRDVSVPPQRDVVSNLINRAVAGKFAARLKKWVIGSEGHSLLNEGSFWLPEVDIVWRLQEWIGNEPNSPTLWISSPEVSQVELSGSRAAALNALVAAWTAELPITSHFCERARYATLSEGQDVEKVGLIGLVYNLITQLLQFNFDNDEFEIPQPQVEALNGSDESWSQALDMLSALLKATPHLCICVIDGLNDLAFSGGEKWCSDFLLMLFEHQRSCCGSFKILLTTSGQSRVLQEHVDVADHIFTHTEAREVIRAGRWYKDSGS